MHYVVNVHTGDVISTWNTETNKTHIWTINDKVVGGGETLEELKIKYPEDAEWMMIADDKLTEILVKEANHKKYNVGKWVPTTEEEFDDMLCILPPEKWERFGVISIFRMCEYQTGNITRHYMRNGDEYFTGNFDTKSYDTYEDIIPKL